MASSQNQETSAQFRAPDSIRPHLDEIARCLWEGHAAILVGAGLSKNALPLSGSGQMPSWEGLADVLYHRLCPRSPSCERKADVLGLADEYTAIFGAAALDDLVRDVIDDNSFAPAEVHSRLIELPWSEVFTTNYDTLLERAAETVISRKYDIVTRVDDLPFSARPRIVKLHGSLPKYTPFILSGEQYRRYPLDYAPFVNTVQQAIMENLLCLIGFSGNDPNFEQWIGWVRDHLGNSMPYVYLIVGSLGMTESKKQALIRKRIIPVDLSLVQGVSGHRLALTFFLDYLEQSRPKVPEEWTCRSSQPLPSGKPTPEQITDVISRWRLQRETYPGWVIAPARQRGMIWHSTEYWMPYLLKADILPPSDLLGAFELDWRMRKSLVHPISEVLEWIERIVRRYNPFPEQLPDLPAGLTPASSDGAGLPWSIIRNCWVELVFTLVKGYRLVLAKKQYDFWMNTVLNKSVLSHSREWTARWHFERCMYHIADLDIDALHDAIEEWPTLKELPLDEIRKGGILIELREYERAERTLRDALNELRRRTNLKPTTYDLTNLSRESLALLALQVIQNDPFPDEDTDSAKRESERRRILRRYECDPLRELSGIGQNLASARPNCDEEVTYTVTFDGRHRYSQHFACALPDGVRSALEFSNFFEEGGVPFKGRHFVLANKDAVENAARILASETPSWALATLARSTHVEALDELFSRTSVARMKQDDVDSTLARYVTILGVATRELPLDRHSLARSTFSTQLCHVLAEVISRLVIKSSTSMRERVFDLAVQLWSVQDDAIHFVFHDSLRDVFHRLIQSADADQVLRWIPRLLSLPLSDQPHDLVRRYKGEPILSVKWPDDYRLPVGFDRSAWTPPIGHLLNLIESGSDFQREVATIRLARLYHIGALNPTEVEHLGDAIWNARWVDQTTGLPRHTGLYDYGLLNLPHPQGMDLHSMVKQRLVSESFPVDAGKQIAITEGDIPIVTELLDSTSPLLARTDSHSRYVGWTKADVLQLFDKIVAWWDSGKDHLSEAESSSFLSVRAEFKARFNHIPTLLWRVIFPRLDADTPESVKAQILRLLDELSSNGIPCLRARVAALTVFPQNVNDATRWLADGLTSSHSSLAGDACVAAATWAILAAQNRIVHPPEEIMESLYDVISFRHMPALGCALQEVRTLITHDLVASLDQKILLGLDHLADETSLGSSSATIRLEDRPEYRRLAAALGYASYDYCKRHSLPSPPVIDRWKQIAHDDPLPEVRREWIQNTAR